MTKPAILVMAYGTPSAPEQIEDYYTHIRRGRTPSPEALADLRDRYDAIGGLSPLMEITSAQVDLIARHAPDATVTLGMKHSAPFIEDAMDELVASGHDSIVGLVLAPHFSGMSVGAYHDRAQTRLGESGDYHGIRSWATEPAYIDFLAGRVTAALETLDGPDGIEVMFTAHSLPQRILESGDPYPDELEATARAVAATAGLARWSVAWQSAGRTPEPWIGPDVLEAIDAAGKRGARGVLVCAAGFVSDHLEVLYDLDIEAASHAERLGLRFARTDSVNGSDAVMSALADTAMSRLAEFAT